MNCNKESARAGISVVRKEEEGKGRRTYFARDGATEEPTGPAGADCPVFNVVRI